MGDKLHIIAKKAVKPNKYSGLPELIPSVEVCMPVEYSKSLDFIRYIDVHRKIRKSIKFKVLPKGMNVWHLVYDSFLDKIHLQSSITGNLPANVLYSNCINNFDDIITDNVIPFEDIKFYLNYTIDI